jgi:single-strand DNA-binding protein
MASDLNRVVLIGRLTKDPDLRHTPSGAPVASFSIANNRTYVASGDKKELVSYFNCVAWNKLAELIAQYCKKGNRIAVEGRLQSRSWDDQDGNKRSTIEVVVENCQFLTPREGGSFEPSQDSGSSAPEPYTNQSEPSSAPMGDDDIPF